MIVNAEGQILGRLASFVAKQALLGKEMIVINAEKALISGKKDIIFRENSEKLGIRNLGNPRKGPFHQKRPDKFVRRAIRGMLPIRSQRGRDAFSRIQVYIGIPKDEIKKRHSIDIDKEKIDNLENLKKTVKDYVTTEEICRYIGGKW